MRRDEARDCDRLCATRLVVASSKATIDASHSESDAAAAVTAGKARSYRLLQKCIRDKPVGDWTTRLPQMSLPWQQGSAAQHFAWFQ